MSTATAPYRSHRRPRLGWLIDRSNRYLALALAFCFAFGVLLLLQVQAAGDGTWFWYAALFHAGYRLYSGMHLALQPLFVLETSANMALFGKSWLVSKIPSLIHLIAYSLGLALLVRKTNLTDGKRALLLVCAFLFSISFEAYRFDDYHVLADCFEIYSLLLLIQIEREESTKRLLGFAAALGTLSGLAITTRLNDGAALFLGVVIGLVCLCRSRRAEATLVFCFATTVTFAAIVALTGDSFHDYASASIFKAAGSKGGAGSVLIYPLLLPWGALKSFASRPADVAFAYWIAAALIAGVLVPRVARRYGPLAGVLSCAGLLVAGVYTRAFQHLLDTISILDRVSAVLVTVGYCLGIMVVARYLRAEFGAQSAWDRTQILILIPLGQLASASMSSGGSHVGLYEPLAVLIVLVAISRPVPLSAQWGGGFFTAAAVLLIIATGVYRWYLPFSWHTYKERPLLLGRTWYRHPVYGPMILDRQLLEMIEPVCQTVGHRPADDLLSLPYPYANYFCDIPPWHGYVQTFFDTSTKDTIDHLISELEASPPRWIFYQRQLYTMELHERIYQHGKPLEHRYLDQLIEREIEEGHWHVVYSSSFGDRPEWDNHWYLIETR